MHTPLARHLPAAAPFPRTLTPMQLRVGPRREPAVAAPGRCAVELDRARGTIAEREAELSAAYARLRRLGSRPHFVCSELDSTLNQTKPFIEGAGFPVNATYAPTGYCNHNSEWVLRSSPARDQLRAWYKGVIA